MNTEELEKEMTQIDLDFQSLVDENNKLNETVRNNEIEKYKLQGEYRRAQRMLDLAKAVPATDNPELANAAE